MTETRTSYPAPGASAVSDDQLSAGAVARMLRENWKLLGALATIAPLIAAVAVLLAPRTYTSIATFFPESRRGGGGLSSLAQQYGISLGGMGGESGPSLPFYVELIRSREILGRMLDDTVAYAGARGPVRQPLVAFLNLKGSTPAERREEGFVRLRGMIRPLANPNTGIVRVDVTSRSPEVSQTLAQRTVDLINEFNLRQRQSQGASERRFAERRLAEMTDSVRAAEWRLQQFESRNKQWQGSPQLRISQERLLSDLTMKRTLHGALAQSYEQARMDEVRDTPVITQLERPLAAVRPDSRRGVQKMMFSVALALIAGLGIAFVRTFVRAQP